MPAPVTDMSSNKKRRIDEKRKFWVDTHPWLSFVILARCILELTFHNSNERSQCSSSSTERSRSFSRSNDTNWFRVRWEVSDHQCQPLPASSKGQQSKYCSKNSQEECSQRPISTAWGRVTSQSFKRRCNSEVRACHICDRALLNSILVEIQTL